MHTTIQILEQLVKKLPIGTNLALLHVMWTLISGHFLSSRGSIHTALTEAGFSAAETRRAWAALRGGSWSMSDLIGSWRSIVLGSGQWQVREYEGFRPVAVDTTGFWRPRLQNWQGKLFHRLSNRAIRGVGIGVISDIGQIGDQRIPLLKQLTYMDPQESEEDFKHRTLLKAGEILADNEVLVHDAGLALDKVQKAGLKQFVLRVAKNFTARENALPLPQKKGDHRSMGHMFALWRTSGKNASSPPQ